jgi:glycerophosphoryl diester phosphodiesterase
MNADEHGYRQESDVDHLRPSAFICGSKRRVRRVGHRGAGKPQNTLAAFERAIAIGVDMVETDVRLSRDGVLVLAHDAEIRTGGREMAVAAHDLADLRALDLGGGERIATLAEALALVKNRCAIMIDLKGEGFEAALVETIRASGMPDEQIVAPGGSDRSRAALRSLDARIPLSLSVDVDWDARITPEFIAGIDTDAVTWEHPLITAERVARLHDRGLFVYAWTVDDLAAMRRVIDAGVDGVITNRPELFALL